MAFINDFANSLYPAMKMLLEVEILNRQCKYEIEVMFLAMCQYFNWTPQNLPKPFLDSEPLLVDVMSDENSETNSLEGSVDGSCEADSEIVDETVEDETIPEDDNLVSPADSAEEDGDDGEED